MASKFRVFIYIFILFSTSSFSQNIVPNGNFDDKRRCSNNSLFRALFRPYSNMHDCKKWFNPSKASPDYYNRCAESGNVTVPKNSLGTQEAHSGDAYIGLGYYNNVKNYEYVEIKLSESLIPSHRYCFSLFVNIPDIAAYSSDEINFALSQKELSAKKKQIIKPEKYFKVFYNNILKDKKEWVLLSYEFEIAVSDPSYKYLTIGWFNENIKYEKIIKKKLAYGKQNVVGDAVYFFIDDVSIVEMKDENDCPCKQTKKDSVVVIKSDSIKNNIGQNIGKSVVLKNLMFETNKTEILSSSFIELDKLADYLISEKNKTIQINGYTDNVGKEEDNQKLSELRAKAVADYLATKGIALERISYKGYGSNSPIERNDTEEGRKKNRRVEFVLNEGKK